jgi:transcriptional regulator with XRE-family HTH domain
MQAMVHGGSPDGHGARRFEARRALPPELGAMLAQARRDHGWSLREAARRVGVTPGTIVHLEKARRAPSLAVAEDIIAAYRLGSFDAERLRSAAVAAGRSSPFRAADGTTEPAGFT